LKKLFYISAITLFFSFFISCKKDKVITSSNVKLSFSQDSVLFDTVFTHIGSTTKLFRVHNRNNGKVNISSIRLARGNASFYRLNVDGVPGKSFSNIEIAAQDSMYIFVEVNIDPTNQNTPFIYRDSILFDLNGSEQHFDLVAFGQNAHYYMIEGKVIESNTLALYYDTLPGTPKNSGVYHMQNDKPHVIYGYLFVDSSQTLIIDAGAEIYLHSGASIWISPYATIQVNGTQSNPVTFQGDRLEQQYKDVPGQWDRIWINEGSINNVINYAVIKNAYIGVHAGYSVFDGLGNTYTPGIANQLTIDRTIIQNCSYAGILGHHYNITGGDNVVVNCGQHILEFDYGGNYTFYQSTFANYWNQSNNSQASNVRTTPSFVFNNYYNGNTLISFDSLYFGNCILDGSMAEEFQFDTIASPMPGFTHPYFFDYCALKTNIGGSNIYNGWTHSNHGIQLHGNGNNIFYSNPGTYDFSLASGSAPLNAGNPAYFLHWPYDIKGTQFGSSPSMGAYGP
jgi:hypothetical protein